jgi:uncharacterized protein YuzE
MTTKKPVADPDCLREHDFSGAVPNPYAERYARGRQVPSGPAPEHPGILLEYDESVDVAYLRVGDARWDHQVRLDDARGVNYAADGSVIGIEILSPRRKGVLLDGLPFPADVARVFRSVGFQVLEHPANT